MSLTAQEKSNILFYLGWPGLTNVVNTTDYSKPVADNLNTTTDEMETNIRALLDKIAATDVKLEAARCRLSAKKVGDIELRDDEVSWLVREKRRLCKELARLIDIQYLGYNGMTEVVV